MMQPLPQEHRVQLVLRIKLAENTGDIGCGISSSITVKGFQLTIALLKLRGIVRTLVMLIHIGL